MTTIAVFDDKLRLTGLKKLPKKTKPKVGEIVVADECDLPTDGSYRWMPDDECFMPRGHGHGKPPPAPIASDRVLYLLARKSSDPEIKNWVAWYEGLNLESN